jgi:hypothetical protein
MHNQCRPVKSRMAPPELGNALPFGLGSEPCAEASPKHFAMIRASLALAGFVLFRAPEGPWLIRRKDRSLPLADLRVVEGLPYRVGAADGERSR